MNPTYVMMTELVEKFEKIGINRYTVSQSPKGYYIGKFGEQNFRAYKNTPNYKEVEKAYEYELSNYMLDLKTKEGAEKRNSFKEFLKEKISKHEWDVLFDYENIFNKAEESLLKTLTKEQIEYYKKIRDFRVEDRYWEVW